MPKKKAAKRRPVRAPKEPPADYKRGDFMADLAKVTRPEAPPDRAG